MDCGENLVKNLIDLFQHFGVGEADHLKAQFGEDAFAFAVFLDLLLVDFPVDLNHQGCVGAVKIYDKPVDPLLAVKLVATELSAAQSLPQQVFR